VDGTGALAHQAEIGALPSSTARDYWDLLKPNVMQLVVFSAGAGLFLAPGTLHPVLALTAILCIAAAAGAAAAINNWYDADIDCRMGRTGRRPTAAGRIAPAEALAAGLTLAILSTMVMGIALGWHAAGWLAFTIFFYVVIYTMWLKRRSAQNIVIGGAAGAFPPIIGWTAVSGELSAMPVVMFLLIFLWTPPHFWALALYRLDDYRNVGVPMLPVVAGRRATIRQIVVYSALMAVVSLVPLALNSVGWLYAIAALGLNADFGAAVWQLWRNGSDRQAMVVFKRSIVYLFGLLLAMIVDHALVGGAL